MLKFHARAEAVSHPESSIKHPASSPALESDRAMRLAALLQITLMIFFRAPELRRGFNLRYDWPIEPATLFDFGFRSFGRRLLFGRMIKNHRAILRADIGALPVQGGRVMVRPENVEKLIVTDLRWIELDFHHLGVSGFVRTNIFIGGVVFCPACIPDRCGQNALQIAQSFFHSPETACSECGFLRIHMGTMTRLGALRNRGAGVR